MNAYLCRGVSVLFVAIVLAASAPALDAAPTAITRGPYLQQATPTGVTVRWRTSAATASLVRFGTTPGNFTVIASNAAAVANHIIPLTGLQPNTKYYYEVGTGTNWFPGGTNNFFTTAPLAGTHKPTRIWVLGDSGHSNSTSVAVRNAYTAFTGARPTDVWLMLGDNAYDDGTDAEHQVAIFNMYPNILQNTPLWPTIGNHDAHEEDANGHFPYFDIFTLPTQAEAGGVPSGTEKYYSFDHANIHFVCLDSMTSARTTNGPMANWLREDLAATTQDWIIAYWHHPPYSRGTHNSDSETELVEMRQIFVPILEHYGVDLVLCGHSHNYERSYLIDGHYGPSSTFSQSMKKDGGNGRVNGTGAYQKPVAGESNAGAVYAVAGSSAQASTPSAHPAMLIRWGLAGSVVIDISTNRLDYTFLTRYGTNADTFTILKPVPIPPNPPAAPVNLVAAAVDTSTINLSWNAGSPDSMGYRMERSSNSTDFALISVVSASVTNGSDIGLAPSSTYYYRVLATNAAGDSPYSTIAHATTFDPPPDTNAPAAVTNLFAGGVTSNSVTLFWTAPGDDGNSGAAASYDVRASTDPITETSWSAATPVPGAPTPASAGNAQAFTIGGLAPGTLHFFALTASDETNNVSPLSNVASAQTYLPGVPLAPTGLTATALATNEIRLTWTDNSDNEDSFKIERSLNGADFELLGAVPAGETNATDSGVLASTTYWYRVSAANSIADSPASNVAQATTPDVIPPDDTPPAAITNLRVASVTNTSVTLAWTAPGDDENIGKAARYDLRLGTNPITEITWATLMPVKGLPAPLPAGATQTVALAGLSPGTRYYFALKTADEEDNLSPISNVPSTTTPGLPPPWRSLDIGNVGLRGSAGLSNNIFTVRGAGSDVGGSADSFHFAHLPAVGDCEIVARLTTLSNTSSSAKTGVMIRESTNSNSAVTMLALKPDKKIVWLRRTGTGKSIATTTASGNKWAPPVWLRVTRTNNVFSAWHSTNGTTWIASSPKTFNMSSNSFIGLGVTSRSTSRLNTSTFDNVSAKP